MQGCFWIIAIRDDRKTASRAYASDGRLGKYGERQARPENSPVDVLTQTLSPAPMYSGTWISMPVWSLAGLVRLVALAPFSSGTVSTTVSATLAGTCRATGASLINCT